MSVIIPKDEMERLMENASKVAKELKDMSPEELNERLSKLNLSESLNKSSEFKIDELIKRLKRINL